MSEMTREEAEKNRRGLEIFKEKSEQHGAAICTTDGKPPDPDYAELHNAPSGPKDAHSKQHGSYYILCEEERKKGFVRPVRRSYQHVGIRPKHPLRDLTPEEHEKYDQYGYVKFEAYKGEGSVTGRFWTVKQLRSGCGSVTTMSLALAETCARDPKFYGATFCCRCNQHFPLEEFVWEGTAEIVGS